MNRVALVHPFSWPHVRRGGERYLHDLAWYLATQGVAVDVVVGGRAGVRQDDGVRIVEIRHPQRLDRRGLNRLDTYGAPALGWLARHRYDVVHAMVPTAGLAAVATRQRSVYTVLGHPTRESLAHRRWDARLFRTVVRSVNAPLALSESAARSVADVARVTPRVVPPGLRVDAFPFDPRPRTGPPRILFPAFAGDRRKGLDLLLRAWPTVLDALPDARLQLGGGGDTDWAYERLTREVADRVRATTDDLGVGELGDLPARYAAATVSVLPSVDEAFGLVLVEWLATGTPVVAVASGGPTEIVTDPRIGLLSPPHDDASLAAAIVDAVALAKDPETPAACHAHARHWDWATSIGPLHLDVYRQVARRWT